MLNILNDYHFFIYNLYTNRVHIDIQGVPNNLLSMTISKMVRGTRFIKSNQSCCIKGKFYQCLCYSKKILSLLDLNEKSNFTINKC